MPLGGSEPAERHPAPPLIRRSRACRHNRTIPDLGPPDHKLRWQLLEAAKHCLIHGLLRLGVPLVSRFDDRQGARLGFKRHHAKDRRRTGRRDFVSRYASGHPWEDFAETWAHHLHIVDTLETASAFGLSVHPKAGRDPALATDIDFDPYRQADLDALIAAWLPLTYAVNSLNQSMGQPDLYPFVLTPTVIGKLRFVRGLIRPNHA